MSSDTGIGLILVVLAYLAGSFPTASIVGLMSGHDHSQEGSGNPGASNVYRTSGRVYGLLTVIADVVKGTVPVLVTMLVLDREWASIVWIAVVIGHVVPLGRFRNGGKGVATGGGGSMPLFPLLGLGLIALFAIVVRVTKRASAASLAITVGLVLGVAVLQQHPVELFAAVIVAAVIVWRHRANIERLVSGDELRV